MTHRTFAIHPASIYLRSLYFNSAFICYSPEGFQTFPDFLQRIFILLVDIRDHISSFSHLLSNRKRNKPLHYYPISSPRTPFYSSNRWTDVGLIYWF
ncbi:hypothetical protein CEXT_20301 [Caerostris extrusa]|uniref:Uncharacterized protein n=1 Tax=Caerostris extrusa TaxID=172846 RepID=A0AAV4TE70_CAEEX|nr:hypothetical protein CEXT_20301 [Caerostris extrusa]